MRVTKIETDDGTLYVPPSEVFGLRVRSDSGRLEVRVGDEWYRLGRIDTDEHLTNGVQSMWSDRVDVIDLTADGMQPSGEPMAPDVVQAVTDKLADDEGGDGH